MNPSTSSAAPLKVLVVGATGALGRPVVQGLLAKGVSVRAVSRHPEQAADLGALGAEVVAADLTDRESLERACAGVQRVFTAAHGFLGRGRWRSEAVDIDGHRTLFEVARQAGVQRVVHTSALGSTEAMPVDFFRHKAAAEAVLKASGLDHVILRPTAFMEHHAHNFNGKAVLDTGKAKLIGPGTKPRNFVCAADVAQFALRALLEDPPPFRELDIGGPGHYSNAEVAALYARAAGIAPRAGHLPRGVAKFLSVAARPLHPGLARVMHIFSLPDDAYSERFDGAAALSERYGIRLRTMEEFVGQQVALARSTAKG
ncbi:MAG: SDR family oxidoreductase [Rubrivivax sp.]